MAQLQEFQHANSELARQAALATERTRVLIDVMRAFAQELELDPLLATIMGSVTQVMHADRSTLFLVDSQTNELWSRVAHEVQIRETRLRQQMTALQIQIDVQKGQREVSEITNSDYFHRLQDLGAEYRRRAGGAR